MAKPFHTQARCLRLPPLALVIMDGGFEGRAINLVSDKLNDHYKEAVKNSFAEKCGKEPIVIDVVIGVGDNGSGLPTSTVNP